MSTDAIKTTEGALSANGGRYALVVARWNSFVVEHLLSGAIDTLKRHGIGEDQLHIVRVPGAFEIPLVCKQVAAKTDCDAIIALGAVIRGGTPHFEHVAGECTKGIAQVQMESGKPIAFGVLTVDSIEQAVERFGNGQLDGSARRKMSEVNALAAQRRRARHFALQGLYQWSMTGAALAEIEAEFRVDNDFTHVDGDYYRDLLTGVVRHADDLDEAMRAKLDRAIDDLDPVEHSLLRMGVYELRERIDVPYKVVLNEAVALAKKFGATESFRYVNGVLDKVAHDLRQLEISAERA